MCKVGKVFQLLSFEYQEHDLSQYRLTYIARFLAVFQHPVWIYPAFITACPNRTVFVIVNTCICIYVKE